MSDLISRQAEDTRVAQNGKYKYTFGNDEFNLEAAYHDCKFVFDGITDDDSFQEADTGLILYYANEIIYALHKALKGNDTNVPSDDCIDRAEAQTVIQFGARRYTVAHEAHGEGRVVWSENLINVTDAMNALRDLPSVQPEPAIPISWIEKEIERLESRKNCFAVMDAAYLKALIKRWRGEQDDR